MSPASESTLFECETCGNLGIGEGEIVCCDGPMQPVEDDAASVDEPTLDELLRTVFDMSETELDICLCVMEGGELTVPDLAKEVGYDRSVVARHLDHLVDLGVIEKRRRLLEEGGQIYVYTPNGADLVARRLTGEFARWAAAATALVESISRQKVEAMVEADTETPQWKIYQK
jgi:predicted transcriptional regulator